MEKTKNEERSKKRRWLLLLLLLLLIGGGAGYYWYQQRPTSVVSGDFLPEGKDARKMSDDELMKAAQKKVDASRFNLVIKPEIEVDKQTGLSNVAIKNPANNAFPVNVEIRLKDSGELVYTSGAIQPGYEIKTGRFEKIPEGKQTGAATFTLYDQETKQKKGQVAATVDIAVVE